MARTYVSNSELGAVRNCTQLHGFAYADMLRPKLEAPYFADGHAFHRGAEAAIAAAFRQDDADLETRTEVAVWWGRAAATAELEAYQRRIVAADLSHEHAGELLKRARERAEVVLGLVERYVRSIPGDLERLVPIALELPFEVPVPDRSGGARTGVRLRGVIDAVWYDADQGDLVVDDHKTTAFGADALLPKLGQDPQLCGYVWATRYLLRSGQLLPGVPALRALGMTDSAINELLGRAHAGKLPVGRVRYNVLRKKLPTEPKTLKDGTISADKRIDTTLEIYRAALERQQAECLACDGAGTVTGKKPGPCKPCDGTGAGREISPKQVEMLAQLTGKTDTWFARLEVWKTDGALERWRREVLVTAREIRALVRNPEFRTRNLWHCTGPGGGCAYAALCSETSMGAFGPAEILKSFRRAEHPHEEWIEASGRTR